MKRVIFAVIVAAAFWFVMFSPWTRDHVNFWVIMACAGVTLILMSAFWGRDFKNQFSFSMKDILIGVGSAVVLYGVFYLGDFFSKLLFDFAQDQVANIYLLKEGENEWHLALLLILLIGPAEEIFWRGYVQRMLEPKYGVWAALVITVLVYTLVHIWSFNFMLIMSALVCGAFWGLLYTYKKNLTTLIISHALWDVSVFVLFPII
jgi:membrane protease YdiL (CAAX protease family)